MLERYMNSDELHKIILGNEAIDSSSIGSDSFKFETLPHLRDDIINFINGCAGNLNDIVGYYAEQIDNDDVVELLIMVAMCATRRVVDNSQPRIDARQALKDAYMKWVDPDAEGFDE